MKKIYSIIIAFTFFYLNTFSQANYQWAYNIAGNGSSGNSIAVDVSGNVYVTGKSVLTSDFDPGPSVVNVAPGIYIAKYNSSGSLLWAESIPADLVKDIELDASNNIYIVGNFSSTTDFDPGLGISNLTNPGISSGYIAKYDLNGNYLWATSYYCCNDNCINSVALDNTGTNVYVAGYDGQTNNDIYFGQYAASTGTLNWGHVLVAGTSFDGATGITVDGSGNCYVTGYFGNQVDFDASFSGTVNVVANGFSNRDIFITKYTSAGNYVWVKQMGGTSDDGEAGVDIGIDAASNIYVTGNFKTTGDFDPGAGTFNLTSVGGDDIFLARYTSTGAFSYAKSFGSSGNEYSHKIYVKSSGDNYITGEFVNTVDFDPSIGVANLTSNGVSDIFFARYNLAGGYNWAYNIGATSTDRGWGITVDATSAYITGSFANTVDFDPSVGTATLNSATGGLSYYAKYSDCAGALSQPGSISGPNTICNGSTNTYSVAVVAGATSYTWSLPGGWTGSSSTNTISTTAGSTSGNITVTAINACGSSPSQTLSVTVNTIPATPGAISGNNPICSGSVNTYSVASVAGATAYTWVKPGGWAGASTTNTISTTASATSGNITVSATNACGTSAIQTLSVTVNTTPATPGTISGNITICSGTANTYSVASVAGATTYNWSYPAGWSGVSTTNSINTNASATSGNVSVSASNACGTSAVKTLSVTVNTIPSTPGAISGLVTLCSGAAASNYSVTAVAGATSYTWSLAGGWSGTSSTNIISATPGTTGVFSITANNACGASTQQTLNVTVNPQPTITVNSGAFCAGKSFTIVPSGASTYTFSGGPVVTPTTNTSYSVSGTSTAGCVSASPAISNVTVNALPSVGATTSNTLLCTGQTATLTASGASTYTFNPGGAGTSIAVSPTVTSTYTVTGTDANGCTNTSMLTQSVSACTGINQISNSDFEINIYPNPFNSKITIVTSSGNVMSSEVETRVQIFNALGSLIYSEKIKGAKTEIDLSKESNGIYFIKVGTVIKKIIKE